MKELPSDSWCSVCELQAPCCIVAAIPLPRVAILNRQLLSRWHDWISIYEHHLHQLSFSHWSIMEKDTLPSYTPVDEIAISRRQRQHRRRVIRLAIIICFVYFVYSTWSQKHMRCERQNDLLLSAERLHADYATCAKLRSVPQESTAQRERNARYIDGHASVLIRNEIGRAHV